MGKVFLCYDRAYSPPDEEEMMHTNFLGDKAHRWNNEELLRLASMWNEELTIEHIAKELKTSSFAISKMVVRLRKSGVPLKRRVKGHRAGRRNQLWTQSEVEYLIKRRRDKVTAEDIAIELNRSVYAVNAMIQSLRRQTVYVERLGQGVRKLWNPDILRAQVGDQITQEYKESFGAVEERKSRPDMGEFIAEKITGS